MKARRRTEPVFIISKTLRFWVDCEYPDRVEEIPGQSGQQVGAEIRREDEETGEAMRFLNRKGKIAWKATPKMLRRLADAEREVEADMQDWP
jgi:hypothetical protein